MSLEEEVARQLNRARRCGLHGSEFDAVFAEFFTAVEDGPPEVLVEEGAVDWDDPMLDTNAGDDVDEIVQADSDMAKRTVSNDEMSVDSVGLFEDTDIEIQEENTEVEDAVQRAVDTFEFMTVPQKTCHCKCGLFNGQPCRDQFSVEETENIRYAIF